MAKPSLTKAKLYRNRAVWGVMAGFWGFIFLLTFGLALNGSAPLAGRLAGVVISVAIGLWLLWAFRCGIRTDEDGVSVRQYRGRTVTIPWPHVECFRLDRGVNLYGGGAWVSVVLHDGQVVRTQALAVNKPDGKWAQDVLAGLECDRAKAT